MSRADARFETFAKAMRAGTPVDQSDLFDGLDRIERLELEDLIDGFLSSSETVPTDLAAFEATRRDDASLKRLGRAVEGVSGLWPSTLPRLAHQAQLGRDEIAQRLGEELGNPQGAEKIKSYYHDMEWGTLPSSGVNDRVIESLARVLDADAEEIRSAGRFGGGGAQQQLGDTPQEDQPTGKFARASMSVFARTIGADQASSMVPRSPGTGEDAHGRVPDESDWDETDHLFMGG